MASWLWHPASSLRPAFWQLFAPQAHIWPATPFLLSGQPRGAPATPSRFSFLLGPGKWDTSECTAAWLLLSGASLRTWGSEMRGPEARGVLPQCKFSSVNTCSGLQFSALFWCCSAHSHLRESILSGHSMLTAPKLDLQSKSVPSLHNVYLQLPLWPLSCHTGQTGPPLHRRQTTFRTGFLVHQCLSILCYKQNMEWPLRKRKVGKNMMKSSRSFICKMRRSLLKCKKNIL